MFDSEYSVGDKIQLSDPSTGKNVRGTVACTCYQGGVVVKVSNPYISGAMSYEDAVAEFPSLMSSSKSARNAYYVYIDDATLAASEYDEY